MLVSFDSKPFADLQCSPLGLEEKKVPDEYRMISNLSYPRNKSINDGIPGKESFNLFDILRLEMPFVISRAVELVYIISKRI